MESLILLVQQRKRTHRQSVSNLNKKDSYTSGNTKKLYVYWLLQSLKIKAFNSYNLRNIDVDLTSLVIHTFEIVQFAMDDGVNYAWRFVWWTELVMKLALLLIYLHNLQTLLLIRNYVLSGNYSSYDVWTTYALRELQLT